MFSVSSIENHWRQLCTKECFLSTFLIFSLIGYQFPLSIIMNQRGETGIPSLYALCKDSHRWLEVFRKQSGTGSEYQARMGSEPLYYMSIPRIICASGGFGESPLYFLYKPSLPPAIDRKSKQARYESQEYTAVSSLVSSSFPLPLVYFSAIGNS